MQHTIQSSVYLNRVNNFNRCATYCQGDATYIRQNETQSDGCTHGLGQANLEEIICYQLFLILAIVAVTPCIHIHVNVSRYVSLTGTLHILMQITFY